MTVAERTSTAEGAGEGGLRCPGALLCPPLASSPPWLADESCTTTTERVEKVAEDRMTRVLLTAWSESSSDPDEEDEEEMLMAAAAHWPRGERKVGIVGGMV